MVENRGPSYLPSSALLVQLPVNSADDEEFVKDVSVHVSDSMIMIEIVKNENDF